MSNDPDRHREGQLSSDRTTIEQWADEHDAVPVREAGASRGERFRVVPESEVRDNQDRLDWDRFFQELDEGEQVVVFREDADSEPFEVTGREEMVDRIDDEELERRLVDGETVTGQITETRVVENVVVEELEVESNLVEAEVVEDRVVDVELLDLECTRCDLGEVAGESVRDWFDTDRYLDAVGDAGIQRPGSQTRSEEARTVDAATGDIDEDDQFPYRADLDVEETWAVTRELLEEYTVESSIVDSSVTDADTLDDYDLEAGELHRSILDQGVFENEAVLREYDVQSEVAADEDGTIRTTFSGQRRVEDEILDRKRLAAEVRSGEYLGMELRQSRDLDWVGEGGETTGSDATGHTEITDDVVGTTVVNATGDEIGMVSDVEPEANTLYVDVDPAATERVMTTLGWSDADEEDYPLGVEEVAGISDDEVRLKGQEEAEESRGDRR